MGSLNETNPSLWVATTPATGFPALAGHVEADVAVVGAGIAGLVTAALCQRDGRRVAVVEAARVASGTTGYTTAKLTALHGLIYDELAQAYGDEGARAYADANLAGMAAVAGLVEELGISCDLESRSAFTYTTDPAMVDTVQAEAAAAQRVGLRAEFTTECDLPFAVEGAVRLDRQAQFHPRRFCLGLAAAIAARGGAVYELSRAMDVEEGDPCVVQTEAGTVTAGHVVVATHLPFLDRGGFFARCHPMRSYALSARIDGPVPSGMYLATDTPTRSLRSARMGGEEILVVGGEGHKVGQDEDTRRRYDALEAWARAHFPVRAVDYRWSAQDHMPVDRVPYVGSAWPGADRVLVATGFQKWGMSNGAAAGIMLADRIGGRESPWIGLFDAQRGNLRQSAADLLKENANVVKRFVGDRLRTEVGRSPDDLAPGEAAVLRTGVHRVAAYRDEAGALHTVSPVCTHMGCTVTWNTAERSWDCPCHGSRFKPDGEVLEGPAVRPLKAREP